MSRKVENVCKEVIEKWSNHQLNNFFSIKDLKVGYRQKDKLYMVMFRLVYETKSHQVVKHMRWGFHDRYIKLIDEAFKHLSDDIRDNSSVVFGKRFSKVQFDKRDYEHKGWKIER